MVTTRRGTETPGMASTPASSAKKIGKRELDALETPTPTQVKRQRKTTVEVKRTWRSTPRKDGAQSQSAESSQEEAEDDTTAGGNASPLAIRRRASPKVLVEPSSPVKEDAAAEEGFHTPEPASPEAAFVTPFTSKKALAGEPTPQAAQQADDTPAAAKKARGRPKKTQKEDEKMAEEIPSSTQESSIASPAVDAQQPKAHVRFGSEEPPATLAAPTPAPAPAAAEQDDDDSASDSDEAPEQVSTTAAASKAATLITNASRAQAAQRAKEQKKREAREQRLAAEQAAKRERDALKAKKAAARAAKAARLSSVAEEAQSDSEEEDSVSVHNRAALPSLLPDSLLDSLDAVRPPTPPPETRGRTDEELRKEKLNRHIKFLEQSSKDPKERKVGKHRVAVLGPQNRNLAGKVGKKTRGVREGWLKGRQDAKGKGKPRIGKTHRAKFGGGGFLRGED